MTPAPEQQGRTRARSGRIGVYRPAYRCGIAGRREPQQPAAGYGHGGGAGPSTEPHTFWGVVGEGFRSGQIAGSQNAPDDVPGGVMEFQVAIA